MQKIKEIVRQIKSINSLLIETNLCKSYRLVKEINGNITWEGYKNIAYVLGDFDYEAIYSQCIENRDYNFMFLDGAIIQMTYLVAHNEIVMHRLAFFPNLNHEKMDDYNVFLEKYYGDIQFSCIDNKNYINFPVRFDYNKNKVLGQNHPYSHLTLGNYKNCRIPVSSPLSPNKFVFFILKNFYHDFYINEIENKKDKLFACSMIRAKTISISEKKELHLNFD